MRVIEALRYIHTEWVIFADAIIVDEWNNETAIPAEDIAEVKVERYF